GCEPAPHSGAPLFYAHALVALPDGLAMDTLITALESLSDDLVVDIDEALSEQ
ncbi:MAG: glycine cleavage system protein R, partial [Aeromonas veronii]